MRTFLLLSTLVLSLMLVGSAHAAPPAGTSIGNQASATYSDDSAIVRTVTSNTVVTVVQQVASFTLTANGAKTSNAGGQVAYPHTLTNTGNGTDTFSLAAANTSGTFNFTSVLMYADANGDGVPDNSTSISTTGELAAGAVFKFVMVGTVPSNAVAGNTNVSTITAGSGFTPAVTTTNTDTTTITVQGVISVTQSLDVTSGPSPSSSARTITLTYTNTGNTTVTTLNLLDDVPSGMTYVANSARWSVTGAGVVLTDAAGGNQSGITYDFGATAGGRVTAVIDSVLAGATGTLTFQVNVKSGLPPGAKPATALTASYSYNDGASPVSSANTNTVQYTVLQVAAVSVSTPTPIASAVQGATVSFTNLVTNLGNGTDSFNITLLSSNYPSGTTLQLFRADGVTPLTDTNGDGVPDTGPVTTTTPVNIVVKATLPANVSGGGPYTVLVHATSVFDASKSADGTDQLTTIAANSVDLTNNTAGGSSPGIGAGPEGSPVVTNTVAPGGTSRFTLVIANNSNVADNFNLAAATNSAMSAALPAGFTVVFHDANGAVISNTGVINAGANVTVYADLTAPANATTGTDLFFRALSPSSGISDGLHDAVTVGTVRSIVLTPNNTGQATPGGTIVYTHTIVNTGTSIEGDGVASNVNLAAASSLNFTNVIYWDKNSNGVLDAGDPIVTNLAALTGGTNGASTAAGLSPGEIATLFVKVTTLPGAANGVTDTTTLSATMTGTIGGVSAPAASTATDSTAIVASNLTLVKKQALDAACDGNADTAFGTGAIGAGAIPGACIRYEITAINAGSANIVTLAINDATPPSTTYHATAAAATTVGTVAAPANGATGSVIATVGTLTPGQSAVLTFGVRIDP